MLVFTLIISALITDISCEVSLDYVYGDNLRTDPLCKLKEVKLNCFAKCGMAYYCLLGVCHCIEGVTKNMNEKTNLTPEEIKKLIEHAEYSYFPNGIKGNTLNKGFEEEIYTPFIPGANISPKIPGINQYTESDDEVEIPFIPGVKIPKYLQFKPNKDREQFIQQIKQRQSTRNREIDNQNNIKYVYVQRPVLRHQIAHFCENLDIARQCIRICRPQGKPAFCGKDHVCYCGHRYINSVGNPTVNEDNYSNYKDMYEKYFGKGADVLFLKAEESTKKPSDNTNQDYIVDL